MSFGSCQSSLATVITVLALNHVYTFQYTLLIGTFVWKSSYFICIFIWTILPNVTFISKYHPQHFPTYINQSYEIVYLLDHFYFVLFLGKKSSSQHYNAILINFSVPIFLLYCNIQISNLARSFHNAINLLTYYL